MLKSVEGIFKDGKIELLEPAPTQTDARVLVTFLEKGGVDLAKRGIDEGQAADLRSRLKTAAADWDRPDMDVYNEP